MLLAASVVSALALITLSAGSASAAASAAAAGIYRDVGVHVKYVGCRELTFENTLPFVDDGFAPFAYFQKVKWCWDGDQVTSISWSDWVEVYEPSVVSLLGYLLPTSTWGPGTSYALLRTQAHIKAMTTHFYPWIQTTVRPGGSYTTLIGKS